MKAIGINGSPRRNWNTATLLEAALAGASEAGAETELVHLYDLDYKGCRSCFACKLRTGKSYGACAASDQLRPLLRQLEEADVLILGSPIYYAMVTGEMRSFLERFLFQYLRYDEQFSSLRMRALPTAFIYTMNVDAPGAEAHRYEPTLSAMESAIGRTLRCPLAPSLYAFDTCQFDDYAKVEATAFDSGHKARRRTEALPIDCQRARKLGKDLVGRAASA